MPDPVTHDDYRIDLDQVDFNCLEECIIDFPETQILVVAVSPTGEPAHVYDLGCAEDTYKHPGVYDDRRLVGTHWLSDDALHELCPTDLDVYDVTQWASDCRTGCLSKEPVLIVGIDAAGEFHLLCCGCARDVQTNPTAHDNVGMTLHGTHILTDALLREMFSEDFDDEG